ncbi:hypothetical protein [Peribacillus alkalitolerans]|uniref:hypothetical protein n=1 Tax=Peribacillus alkalitolerans TaxID=1550385 RepID=UPI0013D7CB0D|nr:hypothetical protein [Peribacillus alkalitolerans]
MEKVRISVHVALLLETVKSNGLTNDEIMRLLEERDYSRFHEVLEGLSEWADLADYYHWNKDEFKKIVNDGYKIKFLTKGGLRTLLRVKYGLNPNEDYEDGVDYFHDVKLSTKELESLCDNLSLNWSVIELVNDESGYDHVIRIHPTFKEIV